MARWLNDNCKFARVDGELCVSDWQLIFIYGLDFCIGRMIELRKNKLYAFYMYTVEAHLLYYRKDFIFFLMIHCFLPIY